MRVLQVVSIVALGIFVVIQLLICVQLFVTPWTSAPGFPVLHYLPEFAQTHVQCISDPMQPSNPLSPSSPPSLNLSQHQGHWLFTSSGQSIGALASTSVLPINIQGEFLLELTGLNSLQPKVFSWVSQRILQHHNSKVSILWLSAFFQVQCSYPYMTPGKSEPLTLWTLDIHKVKVKVLVTQSCLTLCNPMDCSPPGSFIHGIPQARILEWVAISFSSSDSWATRKYMISARKCKD